MVGQLEEPNVIDDVLVQLKLPVVGFTFYYIRVMIGLSDVESSIIYILPSLDPLTILYTRPSIKTEKYLAQALLSRTNFLNKLWNSSVFQLHAW